MRLTSRDECKINVAEAQVTRVRRIESGASWCKYRLHMAAMRQRHVQSNISAGRVEAYVCYQPQHDRKGSLRISMPALMRICSYMERLGRTK